MPAIQFHQLRGQDRRTVTLGGADAYLAGQLVLRPAQALLDDLAGALHRFRLRQQIVSRLGQPIAGGLAHQQLRADAFLQRLQPPRHGGVIDAQAARGHGELAGPRQFEEKTQIVPVHSGFPVQICRACLHIAALSSSKMHCYSQSESSHRPPGP
ncbi:hypothetical protein D3C80_1290120 [compost metagenome]